MSVFHSREWLYHWSGGEERERRPYLSPWNDMLSPPYITCIQSPDRSRELGCAAACRDAVEANAVPWSLGHCSIQSHQDPGEEIHNPTHAERRECGGGMGRRGSSDRVPVSVFPFPCVLGISNNISRQIIKCIEMCFFFPSSSRSSILEGVIFNYQHKQNLLETDDSFMRSLYFPPHSQTLMTKKPGI